MGLLDKILERMRENMNPSEFNLDKTIDKPVLILAFDSLPKIKIDVIKENLKRVEPLKTEPSISMDEDSNDKDTLMCSIEFDGHKIQLVGLNSPVPDGVLNYTVEPSFWDEKQKSKLRKHKAHIICYYEGSDTNAIEQYIALYKIAYSFAGKKLLGVINEAAWTCTPAEVLESILSPEMLADCRKAPSLILWTGFIKMPTEYGVWFFTKGNYLLGIRDLAYLGDKSEVQDVNDLFNNVFYYAFENNIELEAGKTLQLEEGPLLTFKEVEKEKEFIDSPLGTLVIEKV
ncbi:MAG: DUF4261 domain-containing protein [Bacillota bacterium]|nr:DUF4261 domain-containing protein [Bacillota bacterium]